MASRGNFGGRNKSGRGRGPSQAHGKSIHHSSGDVSIGEGSGFNKKQTQRVPNPRGQSHPGRGRSGPFRQNRKQPDGGKAETDDLPSFGSHYTFSFSEQSISSDKYKEKPDFNEKDMRHHTQEDDNGKNAKPKNQKENKRRRRNRNSKTSHTKQSSGSTLLNFSRIRTNTERSGGLGDVDSDDSDYISTVSRCSTSSHEDPANSESDSSTSESDYVSVSSKTDARTSGSQDFGAVKETCSVQKSPDSIPHKNVMSFPTTESFIAVYWDIENCPVPSQKSAIDIVKKIRDTFYDGRTEAEFVVACDARNLSSNVSKELAEAHIDVTHTDSSNKNAADQKLQFFLNRFQHKYEKTNSAIVLISGDSDFASFLNDMRYRHHIYINLICTKSARRALQAAAHKYALYEDFICDLPHRQKTDNTEFYMSVSGFPPEADSKMIKSQLANKIKSVNGRVSKVSGNTAEIVFSNKSAADKAWKILHGRVICGSTVSLKQCTRKYDDSKDSCKKDYSKETLDVLEGKSNLKNSSSTSDKTSDNVHQGSSIKHKAKNTDSKDEPARPTQVVSKNAILKVSVRHKINDADFWKNELMKLLKTTDITVQKSGSNFDGSFFINFSSIGKAQKAQKKLQKFQETSPLAPKFIKLIKDDITCDLSAGCLQEDVVNGVVEKIGEIRKVMELKRKRCLQKFDEKLNYLKKQGADKHGEELNVIRSEIDELKEQKNVFLQYNNQAVLKLNNFNQSQPNLEQMLDDHLKDYSRECCCFVEGHPVYARKDDILRTIRMHQVVVISAEAGSEKSTQIIQYLWRAGFEQKGVIVCTHPRKLCALSLARQVSNQIGSALGGVVGYQDGLSSKKSDKTRISFVTDLTMLKQCVNGELPQEISCIIFDEVQERSVYTDLLLAFTKKVLRKRKDLKVIITCTNYDTSVFCNYFNLTADAVLQISGPAFPIEDVWLERGVNVEWNYLEQAVNTVIDLLKEPPGDILVFLTTPLETEQASFLMKEKLINSDEEVIVRSLHDALEVAEQQKIFDSVPKGLRKIIFATNCAETSITIPGIRYVIDSGMVKESKYDGELNLNVLSIGFVSRYSAEQRRGRAGRTESGRCFRLYSRSNYENNMALNAEPEILRVHLAQAVLQLMALGVQDPTAFDFIEPPSRDSLMTSVKHLIHLGAVDRADKKLTDMGMKMAKLPIEPRMSHLIFKGIEKNIAYESVVIAALTTVSRNVSFSNEYDKKEGAKKVFCPTDSDFLNYLEIFKQWILVPKVEKSQWCQLSNINEKSMRVALELVTGLLEILKSELAIKIKCNVTKDKTFNETMQNIIFYSFSENLCVFSGYYKFGYCSPNLPGELHIHSSSSLFNLGQRKPQYIIYDTILKGSQTYLLNVTPVSEEAVRLAVQHEWLPYDLNRLTSSTLCPYHIGPVGETIVRTFIFGKRGNKRFALEKKLQNFTGDKRCGIEVNFIKGEITVYLASHYHHYVEQVLFPIIKEAQKQLYDEEDQLEVSDLPKLHVILGAGAEVKEIILPGEYREVVVKGKAGIPFTRAVGAVRKFGDLYTVKEHSDHATVIFRNVTSAMKAVNEFEDENFILQPQIWNRDICKGEIFYKVFISMLRRPCNALALISFKSPVDAANAFRSLGDKSISYGLSSLVIETTNNEQQLMLKKLPDNVEKRKLEKILKGHLPEDAEVGKIIIFKNKMLEYCQYDIDQMKQEMVRLVTEYTPFEAVQFEFKKVKPGNMTFNAWAYFRNSLDGQIAVNALNGRQITTEVDKHILQMKPLLTTNVFCDSKIFLAIKDQIEAALNHLKEEKSKGDHLDISAKPTKNNNVVIITIESNNLQDITDARNYILNVLVGKKIYCSGDSRLKQLLSKQGRLFLKKLEDRIPNICIKFNTKNEVVTVIGSKDLCATAEAEMNSHLDNLSRKNYVDLTLFSGDFPKGLLKELAKKYGYDLNSLKTLCNLESIEVNTVRHVLSVSGSTSAVSELKAVLQELSETLRENALSEAYEDEETCSICLMPIDVRFHRLQYCGHACCQECIVFYCMHQEIPLECPKQDCKMPIVIKDINWVFKEDKEVANALLHKALEHFVDNNKDSVHQCPTPGCLMVYRAEKENNCEFCCPSCQNDICTKCHTIFHTGLPCELYKYLQKDENHSLMVWLEIDPKNRKLCPACKTPIQKNGSSDHMACWKCKRHMCWLCERLFPTGNDVNNHQPDCPKISGRVSQMMQK